MSLINVMNMVGSNAVKIQLPAGWQRIHNVFHVSLVRHYNIDSKIKHHPPPVDLDDDVFEVDSIVTHKDSKKKVRKYQIRWKGYGPEHDTWEPRKNLSGCLELVHDYHKYRKLPLDAELSVAE